MKKLTTREELDLLEKEVLGFQKELGLSIPFVLGTIKVRAKRILARLWILGCEQK